MTGVYRIAEHNIAIESNYETVQRLCEDYRTDAEPELTLSVPMEELTEILRKARENYPELPDSEFLPPDYLELAVIYKRLAERTPFWDTVMLHGSAVAVDGACYVFCAKSGTGKSTHARLWRELLGERAVMVNDDKPMVHIRADGSAEAQRFKHDPPHHQVGGLAHAPAAVLPALRRRGHGEDHGSDRAAADEVLPPGLQHGARGGGIVLSNDERMTKMRLRKNYIARTSGNETLLVPAGGSEFAGMVRGNRTLGAILELLRQDTTEEQIVEAMKKRFDAPEERIAADVKKALAELRKIGAIDG